MGALFGGGGCGHVMMRGDYLSELHQVKDPSSFFQPGLDLRLVRFPLVSLLVFHVITVKI